jgi:ComF family protein
MSLLCTCYELFTRLVSPPACAYCYVLLPERDVLCVFCQGLIKPIVSATIALSAKQVMPVFACSAYHEPLKSLVLAKQGAYRVASKQLGVLMAQQLKQVFQDIDYVVPIPLHWTRFSRRGYNQAEVMAREIARLTNKPLLLALKRNRATVLQAPLNKEQRYENVVSAFEVIDVRITGKTIVIIDDLMTTGATLQQAGRALLKLYPHQLRAAVACRVV